MNTTPPTDEQLRARVEEELRRVTVSDLLLQTVVTLVNVAGRRLGLAPGAEGERDLSQARDAIEAVRALMPILEAREGEQLGPVRDVLAELQIAYAKAAQGDPPPPTAPEAGVQDAPQPEQAPEPGPAQSSGRLWLPGQ